MNTLTATGDAATAAEVERNLDLVHRFLLGVMAEPSRYEEVPADASSVLLPDDDPSTFGTNLEMTIHLARAGRNVYLRHITLADLPHPPTAPEVVVGDLTSRG